jgi:4-aminobutyrate aminotransferase-like enzyme
MSLSPSPSKNRLLHALRCARGYVAKVERLNERYRAGQVQVHVPPAFSDADYTLEEAVSASFPISQAVQETAASGLFSSLPVAFDPSESVGPYLATVDRDASGEPYRFLDLGAQIATQGFGENNLEVVEAVLRNLPNAVIRHAHSEYQTVLSLKAKAELARVAPAGTPRVFVVNTGSEAVENAIKAALLFRVLGCCQVQERDRAGEDHGGFLISFDQAFHGRTLGSLAVTQRKRARLGFPTFDWPHASFPFYDPKSPKSTERRELKSLKQIRDLIVTGRQRRRPPGQESFRSEIEAIDDALAGPASGIGPFLNAQKARLSPEVKLRARNTAGVLVEPIQGEGGVRMATGRFFRRLRLLTRIYDVPLLFDEVQTGGGATGTFWAHEAFDLPVPPDAVMWAKKAQCGCLFVSEELATFFQEEKKFNTTWEGDSAGAARMLALLSRLDLEEVRRTGELARELLDGLRREFPEFIQNVRGAGVMLAFDVGRTDWRDVLRERAFRLGLILLPAGERCLRFYPRYDMEPYAIREAVSLLRQAVVDVLSRPRDNAPVHGLRIRRGPLDCPLNGIEAIELSATGFEKYRDAVLAVEIDTYGALSQYPSDVLRSGRRPLLQYTVETLQATIGSPRAVGVALKDRVSERVVAYALGSPLENHDEQGVCDDPRYNDGDTFYLQAVAIHPTVRNRAEIEAHLLDLLLLRVADRGFDYISSLIEARVLATLPSWVSRARVLLTVDNYLGSGIPYVYLTAPVAGGE